MIEFFKAYVVFAWIEVAYFAVTFIYIVKLHFLNLILIEYVDDPFYLLSYDNSSPIWYFTIAIILFIAGGVIIWYRVKEFTNYEREVTESIVIVINILLVIGCMLLIFIFINNPILQAIMSALVTFGLLGYTISNQ